LKKFRHIFFSLCKWIIVVAVSIEIMSFLAISLTNVFLYGTLWEGSYGVRYDPYTLFLQGPRTTHHNPTTPALKHQTLWLFGGSTMRGSTDHDSRTIPSFLSEILNQEGSRLSWTVLNLGEDSYNSLFETKYLQKMLIENASPPDLIIFYDGANDCAYLAQHRTPYGHYGYRRLSALVEGYRNSFFGLLKPLNAALYASFTKEVYDKLMQAVVPIQPGSDLLQKFMDTSEQRYDHINKLAGCYGAKFLVFWQPILWVETGELSPQVREQEREFAIMGERFFAIRHNFLITYQALANRLKGKPYFINFQNILCSRTEPAYKPDGVHLTDAGRRLVAQRMSQVLQQPWLEK